MFYVQMIFIKARARRFPFPRLSAQRKFYSFLPRTAFTLFRIPIAAAGAGMGVTAYINYQIEDFSKWYKSSMQEGIRYFEFLGREISNVFDSSHEESQEEEKVQEAPVIPNRTEKDRFDELKVDDVVVSKSQDNSLMELTKTLIEVRNLLKNVDASAGGSSLTLPSIVVIGSQSSGKSSVLESIIGHEFLPKGSNMVTRRPIELTLINTPNSTEEYAEFPQLKLGKLSSFTKVQNILTDLNLAVSDEECVSSNPIELFIYSPHIPDLSMVDLPGFIQVSTKNQPKLLKKKIAELCEKYIQEPNIILAVSAADVDLANSEALRASRRLDPQGLRTIGVLTKMDLVEPHAGAALLKNTDYPLALGYIGVVNSSKLQKSLIRSEGSFFKKSAEYSGCAVGSNTLRDTLKSVLESRMSLALGGIVDSVRNELDDASYMFKVQYNDRVISPESYVAECVDVLKTRFKDFTADFQKGNVKEKIRLMLEKRIVNICSSTYWTPEAINVLLDNGLEGDRDLKLTESSAKLTRTGVGKASVQLVIDMISEKIQELTEAEPWYHHDKARQQVLELANELLRSKVSVAVEQVENTIKPFKFEVDVNESEWKLGHKFASETLSSLVNEMQTDLHTAKAKSGRRRLRRIMKYLSFVDANPELVVDSPFSEAEISQARQIISSQSQLNIISQRFNAIKSRQCSILSAKSICPEVFLSVVAEKLASTAVLFIYIELLNEFFFQLPRQLDTKMYYSLEKGDIAAFCKENPSIAQHLALQDRKATLEKVMQRLSSLDLKRKKG